MCVAEEMNNAVFKPSFPLLTTRDFSIKRLCTQISHLYKLSLSGRPAGGAAPLPKNRVDSTGRPWHLDYGPQMIMSAISDSLVTNPQRESFMMV